MSKDLTVFKDATFTSLINDKFSTEKIKVVEPTNESLIILPSIDNALFERCVFTFGIMFTRLHNVTFNDCVFGPDSVFTGNYEDNISFKNCKFESMRTLTFYSYPHISVSQCEVIDCDIDADTYFFFTMHQCSISDCRIHGSPQYKITAYP